jgi:L-ascorbate metabolism protein UlaG (beta-lactamase superfamily)
MDDQVELTYIGGPTIVVSMGGFRAITDPTFDPAGSEYTTAIYTLHKTQGPALTPDQIGKLDVALVSHDHHFDNLDRAGRELLKDVERVITTCAGAERLGHGAVGLQPWEGYELPARDGVTLRVIATPARHGPQNGDRGPVIGFVLDVVGAVAPVVYASGDTVFYEGVEEVGHRVKPDVAMLFMGAARVKEVGPAPLTFTAAEGVRVAARIVPDAVIVPLHFDGWTHFSESRADIDAAFARAGLAHRLRWPIAGTPLRLDRRRSDGV